MAFTFPPTLQDSGPLRPAFPGDVTLESTALGAAAPSALGAAAPEADRQAIPGEYAVTGGRTTRLSFRAMSIPLQVADISFRTFSFPRAPPCPWPRRRATLLMVPAVLPAHPASGLRL